MKQTAKVVMENGSLMAEIERPEACEACHACKHGRTEKMLVRLPKGEYAVGDSVELELPDGQVGKASMLAYGVPLIGFGLGLFLGNRLFTSEIAQAATAILLTAVGYALIRALEPRLQKSGAFRPTAAPCAYYHSDNDQEL